MLDINQINKLQNENTKLKEFTQWVLDQWVLDTKEVQDKALLTIQEMGENNNAKCD